MNCLSDICILEARFTDRESFRLRFFLFKRIRGRLILKNTPEEIAPETVPDDMNNSENAKKDAGLRDMHSLCALCAPLKNLPVFLLVCGYGVITKKMPEDARIAEKVMEENGPFVWSLREKEKETQFTFTRREQISPLLEVLEKESVIPVSVHYIPAPDCPDTAESVAGYAESLIKEQMSFKAALKPTPAGSRLAFLLYRKIRLPALGILLVLLTANTFAGNHLERKIGELETERSGLQKKLGAEHALNRQKQELLRQISRQLPWKYNFLCGRTGACVPGKVLLTSLAVQPVSRKAEPGNPAGIEPDKMLIDAETVSTEHVTEFLEKLRLEPFVRTIRLTSLRQKTQTGRLAFSIEILL